MTAITNATNHVRTNILMRKLFGDMRLNRGGFFAVWLIFTLGMIFYSGSYPAGKNFGDSVLRLNERPPTCGTSSTLRLPTWSKPCAPSRESRRLTGAWLRTWG
jgi:hypothetical protein